MAGIPLSTNFDVGAALHLDSREEITKAEMLTINENIYPEDLLVICSDDHKVYLFSKSNESDPETGKFRKFKPEAEITVDDEMSLTSENPVQNKVITIALNGKLGIEDTMPTPSADYLGVISIYGGETTSDYTHGYFYECVSDGEDPATYSWVNIKVQNSYTEAETDALLDGKVDKVPGKQLSTEDFTTAEKTKLDEIDLNTLSEIDELPIPTASLENKTYLLKAPQTGYNLGGIYQCQEVDTDVYDWVLISSANVDIATASTPGIVKPDDETIVVKSDGTIKTGATIPNVFYGTQTEWDNLTTAQKVKYDYLATPIQGSTVVDKIENGNMNPVTSNAVYNALEEVGDQGVKDFVRSTPVKMIAHRGWWGVQYPSGEQFPDISQTIPENSYESLKYCANKRFFGMEMDVQLASDGTFWISHNNNLSSTTGSNINISESTEADLRALTLTNSNCGLPKLDEFMIACRRYNIIPVIELKSETITITSIASFLEILQKTGVANSCFIMSYSDVLLKEVYRLRPDIPIQLITNTLSTSIIDNALENISQTVGFDVSYSAVTAELCNYIHSKNSYIIGWTVSGESDLIAATKLGCDYVETENTINRSIPEMREADPVFLSAYPGVEQVYTKPMRRLIDTRVEAGTHFFRERIKISLLSSDFKALGLNTDTESENYGKCTRAHGIGLYALPEDVLYCHTTLDTTIYKWNIMCLDANGNGCNDYPWCRSPAHRIYNDVGNGANPPKWGYIYCMRVDGEYLNDADYAAFEAAEFYIETDFAKSYDSGYAIYRHGNQVTVSINCQYSGTGNILENLPRPKLSTNAANSIILSCVSGGIISAKITDIGSIVVDWSSGQITGYLRGSITYTCDDYWETNF